MDKLPSDELGNVGENLFRTLCGQARFVCNKSDRDVTGWDFIVELPMAEPGNDMPLDRRPTSACVVQVKSTTGENGSRVSARLSAVDRLSKDPRPALIVVLRLRSDGQPISGYIVHLIGDELAQVLRRLREAETRCDYATNRATISFDYSKRGKRFDLTPEGLKVALERELGTDPNGYILEKQRQLAELGYENGGLEGEALVWIEGPQHLDEIILGLAPIKPKRLSLFDNRFGLRIPYRGPLLDSIEELRVELPRLGDCRVVIRGGAFQPAAIFDAEMFIPPPLAKLWLLVRHPDFTIRFTEEGLNFQTTGAFGNGVKTLEAWAALVRALSYLAEGTASFSINVPGKDGMTLTLPADQKVEGPYLEQLPAILKLLEGWQDLLERAGIGSKEEFSLDAVWEANAAAMTVDILLNPKPIASLEFDDSEGAVQTPTAEAIYFNSCRFADVEISFCVQVTLQALEEDSGRYRSTSFKPLDVRPAVTNLKEYGMEQAHRHQLPLVISPENITIVDFSSAGIIAASEPAKSDPPP